MNPYHREFYQLAATILPILLLAITVQSSFVIRQKYKKNEQKIREYHALVVGGVVVIIMSAEFNALRAIYDNYEKPSLLLQTYFILFMASTFILIEFLTGIYGRTNKLGLYLVRAFIALGVLFSLLSQLTGK